VSGCCKQRWYYTTNYRFLQEVLQKYFAKKASLFCVNPPIHLDFPDKMW